MTTTIKCDDRVYRYIREGFNLETKQRKPDHSVYGYSNSWTDRHAALECIRCGLLQDDGIKLTAKGSSLLCKMKS